MASPTLQQKFVSFAAVLQLLRAAAWFTCGVILLVQALDPTLGAGVNVLRSLGLRQLASALVGVGAVLNGLAQFWAGYHVSTWRRTKLWVITAIIPALDAVAWAEAGLRLDARGEAAFALTGFIFCGLAAMATIGVVAGKSSLNGPY